MHVQRLLTWQSLKHGDEGYSIAVLLRRGLSSIRSFWCAFETCRGRGSTPNSIQKQSTEQKARLSQLGPGHCRPNRGQRLLRRSSSRPVPLAGPTFLACLRKMVVIRMLMRTMMMGAFRHISDRVGGGGWGVWGGWGAMMTTLLRRHPEQYLQKNRFARYLQYFRVVGPSYTYNHQTYFWTLRPRPWDFGEFSAKTRTWAGGRWFRGR